MHPFGGHLSRHFGKSVRLCYLLLPPCSRQPFTTSPTSWYAQRPHHCYVSLDTACLCVFLHEKNDTLTIMFRQLAPDDAYLSCRFTLTRGYEPPLMGLRRLWYTMYHIPSARFYYVLTHGSNERRCECTEERLAYGQCKCHWNRPRRSMRAMTYKRQVISFWEE